MSIDWDFLKDCYNKQNGSIYTTPRAMLKDLYEKHKACNRVGAELLVSSTTVLTKMRSEKIPLGLKGWNGISKGERLILEIGEARIKNMTAKEVAAIIGFTAGYARFILEKKQISYKKNWEWEKGGKRKWKQRKS